MADEKNVEPEQSEAEAAQAGTADAASAPAGDTAPETADAGQSKKDKKKDKKAARDERKAAEDAVKAAEDAAKASEDKYLRLAAEYDNFRKRSAKERENIYTDVRIDTLSKFLPVYDNLERALAAGTTDEAFRKGVEMTFNQLKEVMKKLGIEEIEAVGKTFDPALHNAVMHVEDESLGENEIVQEFQKGFKIGDKVIRFSMVKVAN